MDFSGVQVLQAGALTNEKDERAQSKQVLQIKFLIADLERRADELQREIAMEENRTSIHDAAHYAYPTYAKAAMQRRDNLRRSAEDLKAELKWLTESPLVQSIKSIMA